MTIRRAALFLSASAYRIARLHAFLADAEYYMRFTTFCVEENGRMSIS